MHTILFLMMAVAHLVLLGWGIKLFRRVKSIGLGIVLVVIVGLIYDVVIVAMGRFIGVGETLEMLSLPRFWMHALVTPFLSIMAVELAKQGGLMWAKTKIARVGVWVIAIGFSVEGFFSHLHMELAPIEFADLVRYTEVSGSGSPVPSIIVTIVFFVVGVGLWRKWKWPWLCLAALTIFIGSAPPPSVVGPTLGNMVEVVFLWGILKTADAGWGIGNSE